MLFYLQVTYTTAKHRGTMSTYYCKVGLTAINRTFASLIVGRSGRVGRCGRVVERRTFGRDDRGSTPPAVESDFSVEVTCLELNVISKSNLATVEYSVQNS